jgi:hypothetical protein
LDIETGVRKEPRPDFDELEGEDNEAGDVDEPVEGDEEGNHKAELEKSLDERLAVVDFEQLEEDGERTEIVEFLVGQLHWNDTGVEKITA